jgi:hypothetical protein
MKRVDIVKILTAAKNEQFRIVNGNLIPGWDDRRVSEVVDHCLKAGLVKATSLNYRTSSHAKYILQGLTVEGEYYLEGEPEVEQ